MPHQSWGTRPHRVRPAWSPPRPWRALRRVLIQRGAQAGAGGVGVQSAGFGAGRVRVRGLLPSAPALSKPSPLCLPSFCLLPLLPSSPVSFVISSLIPISSLFSPFSFISQLFLLLSLLSPFIRLLPLPLLLPFLPQPFCLTLHPSPFLASLFSFKPQPSCLAPASWCPFPQPLSPLCSVPGGPVPLRVGGQALPPASPRAAALGALWWVGEVSWVLSGSTSDPVPSLPRRWKRWVPGPWVGGGLAPPPFLPAPPLSPWATHSPSPLRGVGGDITLPAKELSIKIPFLPPPTPGSASGKGGVSPLCSTLGSLPSPTKCQRPS